MNPSMAPPAAAPIPVLAVQTAPGLALTPQACAQLETEVLPVFLATRRWFPQDRDGLPVRVAALTPLPDTTPGVSLVLAELETPGAPEGERILLVLSASWETLPEAPLARLAFAGREGWLAEAADTTAFTQAMLAALRATWRAGQLRAVPEAGLASLALPDPLAVQPIRGEQSNSSVVVGKAAVLKLIRRVAPGVSPETEMTRHLTRAGFTHAPALLGALQQDLTPGPRTLAVLHAYVPNHGDAWGWTLAQGEAALRAARQSGQPPDWTPLQRMTARIGQRLGEMHAVLARPSEDARFAPEPASARHLSSRATQVQDTLARALAALAPRLADMPAREREAAQWLVARRSWLDAHIQALCQAELGQTRIRVHGDFHLGQVLLSPDDATLIDFEGEPANPLSVRRARHSPYKDVAGLLRSLDYAAAMLSRQAADLAALATFHAATAPAFLDAYHHAHPDAGGQDAGRRAALLDLGLLEKAAYEIVYECAHRPDWINIPVNGLARLVQAAEGRQ